MRQWQDDNTTYTVHATLSNDHIFYSTLCCKTVYEEFLTINTRAAVPKARTAEHVTRFAISIGIANKVIYCITKLCNL